MAAAGKTANKSKATDEPTGELAGLSYEQARDELAEVVRGLESGGATLEESIGLLERGELLASVCEARLAGVRTRLTQVQQSQVKHVQRGHVDASVAPEPDGSA